MTHNLPKRVKLSREPVVVNKQALMEQVYSAIHQANVVPFGIANQLLLHTDKALARNMRRVMTIAGSKAINYGPTDGFCTAEKAIGASLFRFWYWHKYGRACDHQWCAKPWLLH
ncbi:hypothetical protein P4S63_11255 [Pseudoalteromonas sp. B193]